MKKRGFTSLTAKSLAALMILSAAAPVLAQGSVYSYGKPVPQAQKSNYAPVNKPNYQTQGGYSLPPLQGRVITVPAGMVISGATPERTISSQYMTAGDPVSFTLSQPYYYAGTEVLPAGTNIQGNAVIAQKAGFSGQYGKLKIMFNNATLPNGQRVAISGKVVTEDGTGILSGGTSTGRLTKAAANTAVGAGSGALLGLIGSAVSGGKKGKGTAIMTGIGGGLGLGKTLVEKGTDVVLDAGQPVDITIDQPLTVGGSQPSVPQQYDNNYGY